MAYDVLQKVLYGDRFVLITLEHLKLCLDQRSFLFEEDDLVSGKI
jgi:hypothetical protein